MKFNFPIEGASGHMIVNYKIIEYHICLIILKSHRDSKIISLVYLKELQYPTTNILK